MAQSFSCLSHVPAAELLPLNPCCISSASHSFSSQHCLSFPAHQKNMLCVYLRQRQYFQGMLWMGIPVPILTGIKNLRINRPYLLNLSGIISDSPSDSLIFPLL